MTKPGISLTVVYRPRWALVLDHVGSALYWLAGRLENLGDRLVRIGNRAMERRLS